KKSGVVKAQEKKERWKEKKVAKRQKTEAQEEEEEEENVQPVVDPLENGFLHHAEREQERMNERLLKKTYSKKNKMVKHLGNSALSLSGFLLSAVLLFAGLAPQHPSPVRLPLPPDHLGEQREPKIEAEREGRDSPEPDSPCPRCAYPGEYCTGQCTVINV
ncbi:hypothetical protein D4764_05G0008600, partial [Takifugu flavidus]